MHTRFLSIATLTFVAIASAAFAGCSDETGSSSTQGASSGSTSASSSGGTGGDGTGGAGTGGAGTGGGTGGTGGGAAAVPETVVSFDPAKGQFVEGLDYKDGTAYVGAVFSGAVVAVDVATKEVKPFGATPPFDINQAALVGISLGPDGLLYGALNTLGMGPTTGIYKFPQAGGQATLFASDPALKFANDIRFGDAGELYVSDSFTGTIFKISKDGATVTPWVASALLAPDPAVCGVQTDFHLGVNGIVRRGDAFYATNTDRASIVKIPVNQDGTAGTPEIYVPTDCATLSGADGIAVDPHTDDLLIAVNYKNTIVRVTADKSVTPVAQGAPLQSPASLAYDKERDALLITSSAFEAVADPSKAKPALVSLPLQ